MPDYTCYRTRRPLTIDGDLAKLAWTITPHSPRFVDMVTGDPAIFDTRAAALWDDQNLYVSFDAEEPFVEAHLTERDSLIFGENDVEVFIDGGDCYYEFEVNARNTVYEVFFIWQDAFGRGTRFDAPEFDVLSHKAVTFGGNFDRTDEYFWRGTHPRGLRWAFLDWDFPGMQSAVKVDGALNQRQTVDRGWTVELAFPWKGMRWLANGRPLPPKDGDVWRIFFGRFEKMVHGGVEVQPHPAWVWTKHGVYDTHQPQCWTAVEFSTTCVDDL